ncbi:hypothetical protein EON67_10740 [archaeon]|nr:MAG: hypothetical protein EON67_10740 [archaeon]
MGVAVWHRHLGLGSVRFIARARARTHTHARGRVSKSSCAYHHCSCTTRACRCRSSDKGKHISYLTLLSAWLTIFYLTFCILQSCIVLYLLRRAPTESAYIQQLCDPGAADSEQHAKLTRAQRAHLHLMRGTQVLLDIALPFEGAVIILFWALLYSSDNGYDTLEWYTQITVHVMSIVIVWADFLLSSARLPDRHVLITLSAGVVYLFWNLGYTKTRTYMFVAAAASATSAALRLAHTHTRTCTL